MFSNNSQRLDLYIALVNNYTASNCVLDSIRIMRKYGNELPEHPGALTLDAKLDRRLNECRGQRNFYITGFSLFLIL